MKISLPGFLLLILFVSSAFGQSGELQEAKSKYLDYYEQKDYPTAVIWAEKAVALAEEEFGKEHENYAAFIHDLAFIYFSIGSYEEADSLYQRVLNIREKVLGKEHPDVASTLNNLAMLYYDQKRYDEAFKCFEEALSINRKFQMSEGIVRNLRNIIFAYIQMEQYEKALSYFEDLLSEQKKLGGESDIPIILNNIAAGYSSQGQFDLALKYYKQAIAFIKEFSNTESISIIVDNIHNLADKHYTLGKNYGFMDRPLEAAQSYEKSARAEEASTQPRLDVLASSLNNAGVFYSEAGQHQNGLKCLEEALKIRRKQGDSEELAVDLSNLGDVIQEIQGQYEKAIEYYKESIAIQRKLGIKGDLAITLNKLGLVYQQSGQYDKAKECHEECLNIARQEGKSEDVATFLINIGVIYLSKGQQFEAMKRFEESLNLLKAIGSEKGMPLVLNYIGDIYMERGHIDTAGIHFEQALKLARKSGNQEEICVSLNNMGLISRARYQSDKSIQFYQEALVIAQNLGREEFTASILCNIGANFHAKGQFDKAINYFEEALTISKKNGYMANTAQLIGGIGLVYHDWGSYEKAITYFQEALNLMRKLGQEREVASILKNMGKVYQSLGEYGTGIKYCEDALEIVRNLNYKIDETEILNTIGEIYESSGLFEKATQAYKEANDLINDIINKSGKAVSKPKMHVQFKWTIESNLTIGKTDSTLQTKIPIFNKEMLSFDKEWGLSVRIKEGFHKLGGVKRAQGQYEEAIKSYKDGLTLAKERGDEAEIAEYLNDIGEVYYDQQKHSQAIDQFQESIAIKEKLRKTAPGTLKRDYLSSQIKTYQSLTSCYVRSGDLSKAFQTAELGRARLLAEQLASSGSTVSIPQMTKIQQELPDETAVLHYSNSNRLDMVIVFITKDTSYCCEFSKLDFVRSILKKFDISIKTLAKSQGKNVKINLIKETGLEPSNRVETQTNFENIIRAYRQLLSGSSLGDMRNVVPISTSGQIIILEVASDLSRALYDLLIQPLTKHLEGISNLIVIPDGIFNFIPFETLIDKSGKYLVENYQIIYEPSIAVLEILKARHYESARRSMLAFGGAIYLSIASNDDTQISNELQLATLQKEIEDAFINRVSMRDIYQSLGISSMADLPGSLKEVAEIAKIIDSTEVFTFNQVSENRLKAMSQSGELTQYKIIHFATHGLVIPEIPELSALVLSQFVKEREGEDGFLNMHEIADLKLKADFVNLSACETGLGKLYAGEGVVGLTQAFLNAGANSLAVSLWQVADASTATFMIEMYKLAKERKIKHSEAITEMKRRFIRGEFGEKYKAPFYWAPFVYYGL